MLYQCFIQNMVTYLGEIIFYYWVLQLFKGNSADFRYGDEWWDSLEHQFTFSCYFIATFSSAFCVYILS